LHHLQRIPVLRFLFLRFHQISRLFLFLSRWWFILPKFLTFLLHLFFIHGHVPRTGFLQFRLFLINFSVLEVERGIPFNFRRDPFLRWGKETNTLLSFLFVWFPIVLERH
jgi:hypothetical protein